MGPLQKDQCHTHRPPWPLCWVVPVSGVQPTLRLASEVPCLAVLRRTSTRHCHGKVAMRLSPGSWAWPRPAQTQKPVACRSSRPPRKHTLLLRDRNVNFLQPWKAASIYGEHLTRGGLAEDRSGDRGRTICQSISVSFKLVKGSDPYLRKQRRNAHLPQQ